MLRLEKRVRTRAVACYNYPLEVGVILRIPEANLEFHSERGSAPPKAFPGNLMEAVFGMTGHKKIKDLFIEKRVPLSVRSHWPLLAAGAEVLWIPGYGRSAVAPVSGQTTAVLHLKAAPI